MLEDILELKALYRNEWAERTERLVASGVPTNLLTFFGKDIVCKTVGGDPAQFVGTNAATTATSLTGSGFAASVAGPPDTGGLVGHMVMGGTTAALFTYGNILSNSTTVLTIDQWHDPTAPESTRSAPVTTTAPYWVVPGGAPAFYMGISINATAPSTATTSLPSELWNSGGGLRRRLASWAHTTGNNPYTIANTFTANGSDSLGGGVTIAKIGLFQNFVNAVVTTANSGGCLFETLLSATATISASGDNVAITDTVTIS